MRTIFKSERPESNDQIFVAKFDGKKTKTLKRFYKKISKRFNFPDHFGNNMDALSDCLFDLSWIEAPHKKLFIKNFDDFLSEEDKETVQYILEIFTDVTKTRMDEDSSFEVVAVKEDEQQV